MKTLTMLLGTALLALAVGCKSSPQPAPAEPANEHQHDDGHENPPSTSVR